MSGEIIEGGSLVLDLKIAKVVQKCPGTYKSLSLLPNPNECNSTLTSGTRGISPYPYIYRC